MWFSPACGKDAASGNLILKATCHADVTKGYPVHFLMDSSGYKTQAVTAAAGMVGIALDTYASGDEGLFMVMGVCNVNVSAAITEGHGIIPDVSEGPRCKTSGAAFTGIVGQAALTEMGVALETTSAAGEAKCLVNGLNVTAVA